MNTLPPIFDWLLAASARAALLTVIVLLAQALLRHRVPARWRYALWLPVLLVLLTPAFPESAWSVGSVIHPAPVPLTERYLMGEGAISPAPASPVTAAETPGSISWRPLLCLAWLTGAAGLLLFGLAAGAQMRWRFQRARRPVSEGLRREIALLTGEIGLRRPPRVWMATSIGSPAVTGLLRPTLLLPAHFEETLTASEARLVLRHELTHIQRGDLPLHALLCLLLALHWFNPLLWLAFFKVRLDREAACDAQVLAGESQAQRVAYGHTLLKVETAFRPLGLSLGFVGIFQRGPALRTRIQSIATQPTPHPLMKTALAASIVLLTFLGITKAASVDPRAPQILIETKFVEISERVPKLADGTPLPAPLPAPLNGTGKGLIGTFTDPEFQVLIRQINQRKGIDLLSAPRLTTRSGQGAKVEIVREFAYQDKAGKRVIQPTGVTLDVLPKMTADRRLHLEVSPELVEFERMINHQSGWKEPIFNRRKTTVRAALASGQTIVLQMPSRTDSQIVEDTDIAGHVISRETVHYQRRLFVFVSARILDPTPGHPGTAKASTSKSHFKPGATH